VPRKRTTQGLPGLLGVLKASGVASAEFHPDGRLAAVRFGGSADQADESAPVAKPAAEPWAEHKAALRVLQGGTKDMDDEDLS
jgi:hypothetical protein